ncbi:hypothetical protein [Actinoplanes sp. NPDC026619]|uniref:hypothetical protein n=1 Tax=Actinoplanes sp. NPDC026619 TaxID=3155798 RepID=UPI003409335C
MGLTVGGRLLMDPVTGAIAKKATSSVMAGLGKLAQPSRVEKLVSRALLKRDRSLPKPSFAEGRRLEKLLAQPDIWALIMNNSVQVSDDLVDEVSRCLSTEDEKMRRAQAQDLAELFVGELPAALDPEDRTVLNSYQNRQIADQLVELRTIAAGTSTIAKPLLSEAADVAEYRRQLRDELDHRKPSIKFNLMYSDSEHGIEPLEALVGVAKSSRQVAVHAVAGSGKSVALLDLALRLDDSADDLVPTPLS